MTSDAAGNTPTRYILRKDVRSISEDFWVEDQSGQRAFKVDGKVLSIKHAFALEDPEGAVVATIGEQFFHVRDAMEIDIGDRKIKVHQEIPGKRDLYIVRMPDGPNLRVSGKVADHEYTITADDATVGTVSTTWFDVLHTFGIEVSDGQDPVLILSIAVAMDSMAY